MIKEDTKPASDENPEDPNTDVRPDPQTHPQSEIKKKTEPNEENENETTLDKFIYNNVDGHCGFVAAIALLIILGLLVNMSLSDTFLRQSVELTVQIQTDYPEYSTLVPQIKTALLIFAFLLMTIQVMFKYKVQGIRYLTFLGFCLNASVLLKIISNQPKPNDLIDYRGDAFDARFKILDFCYCNDGFLDLGLVFFTFTCFNTSYYIGKYHQGLPRYILLTYTLSIGLISTYAFCLLFSGENGIPQLILSVLIGMHWVAIEAYALKPFDVFVRENIAKEIEKEDEVWDRTVMISVLAFGCFLIVALIIYIKWSVLVNSKNDPKICEGVEKIGERTHYYMAERISVIMITFFPFVTHWYLNSRQLDYTYNPDYYKTNGCMKLILKWFIKTLSLSPLLITWYMHDVGIFADFGVSFLVNILTAKLFVSTSSKLEKWLRIDTLGDISISDITHDQKKELHEKKLEDKRKARQEEKRKQRKTDFKMGTQEFKDDALPSKKELQRVESPFDFNFDSPEADTRTPPGEIKKSRFDFQIGRLPNEMDLSEELKVARASLGETGPHGEKGQKLEITEGGNFVSGTKDTPEMRPELKYAL